jgi:hypothetical protein
MSYETREQPLAGVGVVQLSCNCVPLDGSDVSDTSAVREGAACRVIGVSTNKQSKRRFFIAFSNANRVTVEDCKGAIQYLIQFNHVVTRCQCTYTMEVCIGFVLFVTGRNNLNLARNCYFMHQTSKNIHVVQLLKQRPELPTHAKRFVSVACFREIYRYIILRTKLPRSSLF